MEGNYVKFFIDDKFKVFFIVDVFVDVEINDNVGFLDDEIEVLFELDV